MNKGLEALNDLRTFTKCCKTNTPFPKLISEEKCYDIIEKELKALAILIYWYQPDIIHDLCCLGASDEEINLVREVLKE